MHRYVRQVVAPTIAAVWALQPLNPVWAHVGVAQSAVSTEEPAEPAPTSAATDAEAPTIDADDAPASGTETSDATTPAPAEAEAGATTDTASEEPSAPPPPVVPPGPERPLEPRVGGKPAKGKGLLIAGGVVTGLAAAGLVTSILVTKNCSYEGPLSCSAEDEDTFLIPLASTGLALGLVLLGVGIGYHARYRKWERWTPATAGRRATLVPLLTPKSAGVGYSMQF